MQESGILTNGNDAMGCRRLSTAASLALMCQSLLRYALECSGVGQPALQAQCHLGLCGLSLECCPAGASCCHVNMTAAVLC